MSTPEYNIVRLDDGEQFKVVNTETGYVVNTLAGSFGQRIWECLQLYGNPERVKRSSKMFEIRKIRGETGTNNSRDTAKSSDLAFVHKLPEDLFSADIHTETGCINCETFAQFVCNSATKTLLPAVMGAYPKSVEAAESSGSQVLCIYADHHFRELAEKGYREHLHTAIILGADENDAPVLVEHRGNGSYVRLGGPHTPYYYQGKYKKLISPAEYFSLGLHRHNPPLKDSNDTDLEFCATLEPCSS